jgi:hypothetical protein
MWLFPLKKTPKANIRPVGNFSPEEVDNTHIGYTGEAALPNVPVNARASDWGASPLLQKNSTLSQFRKSGCGFMPHSNASTGQNRPVALSSLRTTQYLLPAAAGI